MWAPQAQILGGLVADARGDFHGGAQAIAEGFQVPESDEILIATVVGCFVVVAGTRKRYM